MTIKRGETRYRLIKVLLQAEEPASLADLAVQCSASARRLKPLLAELVQQDQVVEGDLIDGRPGPHYRWAAYWREASKRRAAGSRKRLKTAVSAERAVPARRLEIDGADVVAFHRFVIDEYTPPADKRFLVFFQCSVRRPFSRSPSHGTIRRAVSTSTGFDPWRDFEACPVHVVVLASRIGPVPYELEDVHPANVGGGGVKHFRADHYTRVRPILAGRMAEYITTHGANYRRMAAFTSGRYGEVMRDAAQIAGVEFSIFPQEDGPRILRVGQSRPRTYWQKRWIQLYLEIVSWLRPAERRQAAKRLKAAGVQYR